jgi:hypothetical protein
MKFKMMIMAAAAFGLAAGAQAKGIPETGTVIVYRGWSPSGAFGSLPFNVDHGVGTKISNGTYYRLTLPVGDHVISHDHLFGAGQDPQTVHVEAGKTVYFQYMATMALIFEVADNQEKAAQTVSKLKPLN